MSETGSDPGAWYRPARVHLADYDPGWPEQFEKEAVLLRAAFGARVLAVEHIGSTAVPGMDAKPIIDLMMEVDTVEPFDELRESLARLGYVYTAESELDDPNRRVFRKGPADMRELRTHQLHIAELGSKYWLRIISFRDVLRRDPDAAAKYLELKRSLAARHENDSRAYTKGKSTFVMAQHRRPRPEGPTTPPPAAAYRPDWRD